MLINRELTAVIKTGMETLKDSFFDELHLIADSSMRKPYPISDHS